MLVFSLLVQSYSFALDEISQRVCSLDYFCYYFCSVRSNGDRNAHGLTLVALSAILNDFVPYEYTFLLVLLTTARLLVEDSGFVARFAIMHGHRCTLYTRTHRLIAAAVLRRIRR